MKILIVCFFLLTLGLASATPSGSLSNFFYALDAPGKEQNDEVATSQFIPTCLIIELAKAAPKVISGVIELLRYAVCNNTDSQLQHFANSGERDANIMALVKVMNDLLVAEKKLDEVKQLNMKGNLVAKAEFFGWVDSVKNKLKSTFHKIGAATKKLLCK